MGAQKLVLERFTNQRRDRSAALRGRGICRSKTRLKARKAANVADVDHMLRTTFPVAKPTSGQRIDILSRDVSRFGKLAALLLKGGFELTYLPPSFHTLSKLESTLAPLIIYDHVKSKSMAHDTLRLILASPASPSVVVMMSSDDLDNRIACLEMGADDCVSISCGDRELYARLSAIWRRRVQQPTVKDGLAPQIARFARWEIDFTERLVMEGTQVRRDFTPLDFRLLAVLLKDAQQVVDRPTLLDAAGTGNADPSKRSIDAAISRLRKKFGPNGEEVIRTVPGCGYLFVPTVQWA